MRLSNSSRDQQQQPQPGDDESSTAVAAVVVEGSEPHKYQWHLHRRSININNTSITHYSKCANITTEDKVEPVSHPYHLI